MKDLHAMFEEALEIVLDSGIEWNHPIVECKINKRAKKRWGMCSFNGLTQTYTIEISERILRDEVPYNETMSTLIHEILHATDAIGHGWKWKQYAQMVMNKFPQYEITRCRSAEKFGLAEEQREIMSKHAVQCEKCGKIIYRSRMSALIKNPHLYEHICGGKFKRVK